MFGRVLVANRGEIAVRVIRALHELGVEAGPSTRQPTATRCTCASPTRPCASARRRRRRATCDPERHRRRGDDRLRGRPPGVRIPRGEPRLRARLRGERPRLRRPVARGDGAARRQGAGEGRDVRCRRASSSRERTAPARSRRFARRPPRSAFPSQAQGAGGRRREGHATRRRPRRARGRVRRGGGRGDAAFGDGSPPREGDLPARHVEIQVLCDGLGGVLTLGSANAPSSAVTQKPGGVALIALTPETREEMEASVAACVAVGYQGAGTFEFVLGPEGSRVLHRGELPPAGRAPALGARHGHRHRARAGADRGGRAAARRRTCAASRPRHRGADQRGGPRPRLRAGTRGRQAVRAPARPASGSTRPSRRARRSRRSTT